MPARRFHSAILLLAISLASCSPRAMPTPTKIIASAPSGLAPTVTETATPTMHPTASLTSTEAGPRIVLADQILETHSIHSISLSSITGMDQPSVQLALDDPYIYLAGDERLGSLYRLPLAGGNLEHITGSKYADGRLNLFPPIVTGNWIVFADTPATLQGISGRWMVRAVNLVDFSERVVEESVNDPLNTITTQYFAGEAGKLYWTTPIYATDGKINETILSVMNLDDGKTILLLQLSYLDWTWSLLQVSNGQLVLQRDTGDHHSDIFLFDPASGQMNALSNNGISNRPLFSFPWVVWELTPRDPGTDQPGKSQLQVYNLQTLDSRTISFPGSYNSDPLLDGTFVYWSGTSDEAAVPYAFYIFDLAKNIIYVYPAPRANVLFPQILIRGKTIAWIREDVSAGAGGGYLEWTTLK